MDLQTVIALLIVAGAVAYVLRRWVAVWRGKAEPGCHSHGCSGCAHNSGCTDTRPGEGSRV